MLNQQLEPQTVLRPIPARAEHQLEVPVDAIEHCRQITKAHSSTFYLGSRFFPREQRFAVWAVYAACRIGDDIADELEASVARVELERWRNRIKLALSGTPENDPMSLALAWARSKFPIKQGPFEELYLGLKMDLEEVQYETLDQLMTYCRRVAGVVGWMIAPIGGFSGGDTTLERALKMGMAMQLTNILRDVGEDLERNRIYLPRELLERHGVNEHDLRAGRITPQYIAMLRELDVLARRNYREGWGGLAKLHGPAGFAVALAAASYEGILGKLEMNGFDNFSKRAIVPGREKLAMIPRVWWTLRSAGSSDGLL
jgi:15-cis-phytoene synthase